MIPILLFLLENEDDRALMESYYLKYRQLLFKVAHRYLDDLQLDEDCVQNALIGVINAFQRFKSLNEETQRNYIATICRRCAFKLNEQGNHYSDERLEEKLSHKAVGIQLESFNDYQRSDLAAAINCLDDKYREPIIMRYLEQCPAAEIAETFGITKNLVYQRISRGKEKLLKILSEV